MDNLKYSLDLRDTNKHISYSYWWLLTRINDPVDTFDPRISLIHCQAEFLSRDLTLDFMVAKGIFTNPILVLLRLTFTIVLLRLTIQ